MSSETPDQQAPVPEVTPSISSEERVRLEEALRIELQKQEDPVYAVVGGLAAALVAAVLWAAITVATKHQIGYMAIGVGLLVGFAVRFFGAGVQKYFGGIGAFFALFGCLLGNILTQVGLAAHDQSIGYFEVLSSLNLDSIASIFAETFSPIDLLFYGLAIYEGFRFGFRNIDDELFTAVQQGEVTPHPFLRWRLPAVIVLFVGLSVVGFVVGRGSSGPRTFNYDSGKKKLVGEVSNGFQQGPWVAYWENGNVQWTLAFKDGRPDGIGRYYYEDGKPHEVSEFKSGVRDGQWIEYYADSVLQTKGQYKLGRKDGEWVTYYENGKLASKGSYYLDSENGLWESYYDNGTPSAKGLYKKGIQEGEWTYWFMNGKKNMEVRTGIDPVEGSVRQIMNVWDVDGNQEIANGAGILKVRSSEGTVIETGMLKDGKRVGVWKKMYENGARKEEGEYRADGIFRVKTIWGRDGKVLIANGTGIYEDKSADGTIIETGRLESGVRTGLWTAFHQDGTTKRQIANFDNGKLEGVYTTYFTSGSPEVSGTFHLGQQVDEWVWFAADSAVESSVSFKMGKKDGPQLFFEEGVLMRKEIYKDGELVEATLADN